MPNLFRNNLRFEQRGRTNSKNTNFQKRSKSAPTKRKAKELPAWDNTVSDLKQYRLNEKELQQRKQSYISPNMEIAREELRNKTTKKPADLFTEVDNLLEMWFPPQRLAPTPMPEPKEEREENISFSDFSVPSQQKKSKAVTTTVVEFGEDAESVRKSPPELQTAKSGKVISNPKLQTIKKQSEKRQSISPIPDDQERLFEKLSWDFNEHERQGIAQLQETLLVQGTKMEKMQQKLEELQVERDHLRGRNDTLQESFDKYKMETSHQFELMKEEMESLRRQLEKEISSKYEDLFTKFSNEVKKLQSEIQPKEIESNIPMIQNPKVLSQGENLQVKNRSPVPIPQVEELVEYSPTLKSNLGKGSMEFTSKVVHAQIKKSAPGKENRYMKPMATMRM